MHSIYIHVDDCGAISAGYIDGCACFISRGPPNTGAHASYQGQSPGAPPVGPAGTTSQSPDAPAADVFAGSSYGGDENVGGVDVKGFLNDNDPRDFMYGRDPNYAKDTAAAERSRADIASQQLTGQAATANIRGEQLGQQLGGYGQQVMQSANAAQGRAGAQANYQGANSVYQTAKNNAGQLAGLEATQGPSGAQAQLQSGLNQSEASNLAMARSGRGWGGSASALSQAASQNAAAGQQAANSSASLKAQEDAAWRQRQASNLTGAAGITTNVAGAQQQQALSQAQLQQQTTAQNDQAQAALTAQGIDAMKSGAGITQAGETLDLQGTQAAMGAYAQGEQMAGLNMSAQQQGDLTRESGLLTKLGVDAGVAVSNQNAINSGWGTAASTAATIGGVALAASDANAKSGIKPLDSVAAAPPKKPDAASSQATSVQAPAKTENKWLTPALQVGGAAIGTAIAPGIGTAIGGLAGGIAGKILSSDIHAKSTIAPIDTDALDEAQVRQGGIVIPPGGMYGQSAPAGHAGSIGAPGKTDPSGSMRAGAENAMTSGRESAEKASNAATGRIEAEDDAKTAAQRSMLMGAAGNIGGVFGGGQDSLGTLGRFESMGHSPGYGMQPSGWGTMGQPGMIASDVHSKTAIKNLHEENQALKSTLAEQARAPAPAPTQAELDQAYSDQSHARAAFSAYPDDIDDAQGPTLEMLNQAAADQDAAAHAVPTAMVPMPRRIANRVTPYRSASVTSDEREKTHSAALDMVDEAPGYSYEYKNPARHGYGQKFGPMAQDLLKTPVGASTVERAPDGTLAVNTGRLALAEHAALHSMHKENELKFDRLKSEIDALKSGAVVTSNDGAEGGSGMDDSPPPAPVEAAPDHHFWEVPDYGNGGRYVPFWNLPSEPYEPAVRLRNRFHNSMRG